MDSLYFISGFKIMPTEFTLLSNSFINNINFFIPVLQITSTGWAIEVIGVDR